MSASDAQLNGGAQSPQADPPDPPRPAESGSLLGALRQVVKPLQDFGQVPRPLSIGVNIPYFIEGLCYFGTLTILTKFLSENVGIGDVGGHRLVGAFTAGITAAMFLLGGLADRWGVRRSLIISLLLMLLGRIVLTLGDTLHLPAGVISPMSICVVGGMLLVVIGYGSFQPSAYAAVKSYTDEKTAAMGYALLYAFSNLGAFASGWISSAIRPRGVKLFPPNGLSGVLWVYVGLTVVSLILTALMLPKRGDAEKLAAAALRLETVKEDLGPPLSRKERFYRYLREHPLANARFSFFIFALIPVQTLFAHGWLTLPQYIERAYRAYPWISSHFEPLSNLNPFIVFLGAPIVAALTARANVYRMMLIGTTVMAAPTILLALGPSPWRLVTFSIAMSIGEALWQPRFLQYAAEIAPPGKTGQYIGVAQFPWFLTKFITGQYSGWFMARYCPAEGPQNTEFMWLVYTFIALSSPLVLLLASSWIKAGLASDHGGKAPAK